MVCAFVTVNGVTFSPDGQSAILSGTVVFSDRPQGVTNATFAIPLSSIPAPGDINTVITQATQAVQQITGRTVDRVLISGWFW